MIELALPDDIQIKFRIVQALNENQIIIGLNEVQEHDLTKVFRHLYIKKQRCISRDRRTEE